MRQYAPENLVMLSGAKQLEKDMKKLLDLGFKKITTEDGFVMFELSPARLHASKQLDPSHKQQATSVKQQAAGSRMRQFVAFTSKEDKIIHNQTN
jgi:hypothetical protein